VASAEPLFGMHRASSAASWPVNNSWLAEASTHNNPLERPRKQRGVSVPRFATCARLHQETAVAGRSMDR